MIIMPRRTLVPGCLAIALTALAACSQSSPSPAGPTPPPTPGAPTLTAPTPDAPAGDVQLETVRPTLTVRNGTSTVAGARVYEFQVSDRSDFSAMVAAQSGIAEGAGGNTSFTPANDLQPSTQMFWRARVSQGSATSDWSVTAQFRTAVLPFLIRDTPAIFDPLTNGSSVGAVRGGRFTSEGWEATSAGDGIDYDIATCTSCRLEFDVLGFANGLYMFGIGEAKLISMGDASTFGSFSGFRDHPWKVQMGVASIDDGTGLDVVWRNGGGGEGTNPGDHRVKIAPGPAWSHTQPSRVVLEWTPAGFAVSVDGKVWVNGHFGGLAFAPPNHRISLGCYPRNESFEFAIYRNVTLTRIN
jgi:hypothetical protein